MHRGDILTTFTCRLSRYLQALLTVESYIFQFKNFCHFWANFPKRHAYAVFMGSSERMNYMHTLWLGPQIFLKPLKPFQKPRCSKSDINEVHLKFRHCMGVVAHNLKIPWVCLSLHSCKWLSLLGTLEMQSQHVFWRMYTLKSKTVIMETNVWHSVSKSVAWYQSYVHIKACLATGYIHTVWRQV